MGRIRFLRHVGASVLAASAVFLFACTGGLAYADEGVSLRGDASAYVAEGERLFDFLQNAENEDAGRAIELEIWAYWMHAPDEASRQLMTKAQERRRNRDHAGAIAVLNELIAIAPDWAEAWNQRATMRYMQGEYEASLADIEETLLREPRHFGAMAGMALILVQQGRARQAQAILRNAVAIHPYLRERWMIAEPPGQDL